MLIEIDLILKNENYKQNLVRPASFSIRKMILILLIEVITFHIKPTIINVKRLGFELISRQLSF